jgi:hypothetical protein
MTGTVGTYTGLNPTTDPYPSIPLPATYVTSPPLTYSSISSSCPSGQSEVQHYLGALYSPSPSDFFIFGGQPGTYVPINWDSMASNANYYLLPGCDGTTVTGTVPGVFYFTGTIQNNGGHITNIESFSSTVMLPNAATSAPFSFTNNAGVSSSFALQAPGLGSGPYAGIALTQLRTPDSTTISGINCGSGTSGHGLGLSQIQLQGHNTIGGNPHTIGIVDVPCTSISVAGNGSTTCSAPDIQGALVANDWDTGGGSEVCVIYDSQYHSSFSGGAALVY